MRDLHVEEKTLGVDYTGVVGFFPCLIVLEVDFGVWIIRGCGYIAG